MTLDQTIPGALQSAMQHQQAGRIQQAEQIYREILAVDPGNEGANFHLGLIAYQVGKYEIATQLFSKATEENQYNPTSYYYLGFALLMQGRHEDAIRSFKQALSIKPDFVEAHNILGIAYRGQGKLDDAILSFNNALNIKPDNMDVHNNLGLALMEQGKQDEAQRSFQRALEINPDFAEANNNLGKILSEQGKFDQAAGLLKHAIEIKPDYTGAHCNLGNVQKELGDLDEAVASFKKTISINPDYAIAYSNLGNVYLKQSSLDKAVSAYQKALSLNPEFAEAYYNLGNVFLKLGQPGEAVVNYRKALALKPDFATAHSNLLCALHYLPEVSQERVFKESIKWDRQHAQPLMAQQKPHDNSRVKDRRLRIGYVSPDFKAHAVNYFFEPLLKAHDRKHFEIYLYSNVRNPDEITRRLMAEADYWLSIVKMSDEEVAEQIRDDRIDILVDLAKHTADNRLLIFAYKPAPIQATWLGYPSTTGMQAIDYRFVDAFTNPIGKADELNTEELIRLADGIFHLQPIEKAPELTDIPSKKSNNVTLGSFNNLQKINPAVIGVWAEILNGLPDSRLLIIGKELEVDSVKKRFDNLFSGHGVKTDRIERIPSLPYFDFLAILESIDIALDPFPYNGHTTTCNSLWMGVPVITLRGKANCSMMGASILARIGLTELIAENEEGYVDKVLSLAKDPKRLSAMRLGMRERIAASSLGDIRAFTESIENAYLKMWDRYISDNEIRTNPSLETGDNPLKKSLRDS